MGAPSLDKFRKELPSQFINAGVAEQNAILISAGLTLVGKKVFVYSIAPFITLRCLEQIRLNISLMGLPITIVGVGAGVGYYKDGPTHHIIEDISILRTFPNLVIHTISDNIMASAIAEISYKMKAPNYVRLERQIIPVIYEKNTDFSKGLYVLRESKDFYIITCGVMVHLALEVSDLLKKRKINVGVIDLFTLPIPEVFIDIIKKAKKILTLEEHFLTGGLGSAVNEVLCDSKLFIPLERIGISRSKGYCYKYGEREVIWKYYNLDRKSIVERIINFIKY